MVTLRELLSTPYVMTVRPVRDPETGESTRRAEFSEMPTCFIDDLSPWDAMDRLEEQLPAMLIKALLAGATIPRPRPPLQHVDVEQLLADRGLSAWTRHLDTDIATLTAKPPSLPRRVPSPSGDASITAR
jgi:hypothetical protein